MELTEEVMVCVDAFSSRGRKRSEDHLPNLLNDITAIVDNQSQADPQFRIDGPEGLERRGAPDVRDDCDQAQHAGQFFRKK